jgi:hypothetical protein
MFPNPQRLSMKVAALATLAVCAVACAHESRSAAQADAQCPGDNVAALRKPCAHEGQTCGSARCGTAGGWCNFMECRGGRWENVEVPPGPAPSATPAQPTACVRDADCGPEGLCAFAISAGCGAKGRCTPRRPFCKRVAPGCACSGVTIQIGCDGRPSGDAPEPLAHEGQCVSEPSPPARPPTPPAWRQAPSMCPGGGAPCGASCCAAGQVCCPGGMANSHYCHAATPGQNCPALP